MYFNNDAELNADTNSNIHIINRTSGKNCSTSSTDSGVGLVDNANTTFRAGPTTAKDSKNYNSSWQNANDETKNTNDKEEAKTETSSQRISIEVEATVNLNKTSNNNNNSKRKPSKTSPALSIRSTTISIVSIDENAPDSSCIDSDSEAEPDDGCTVQKLGQQISNPSHPPHSEQLSQLNKGLTVISRQVMPGDGQAPNSASDAVAKQLLNGNLSLATPTTPAASQQIGSIALTNTTDVTFGDKHYYEGPVTIQQILIDSRDKWKTADGEENGHDNPAFNSQATQNGNAPANKVDETYVEPMLCPFLPHAISRKALIITAIIVVITIVGGVLIGTTANLFGKTINKSKLGDGDDSRQNIPINSTIDSLELISVKDWGGRPAKHELDKLKLPVHRAIISHTAGEGCETRDICESRVQVVQDFHMDSWGWDHIGYNFLIGGDGLVYEGRGWDSQGAHTMGYNIDSIGISFIGTFINIMPTEGQLQACKLLLAEGVRLNKLVPDYKLYGHRQLSATESPGELLYKIIQTWPHWTNESVV